MKSKPSFLNKEISSVLRVIREKKSQKKIPAAIGSFKRNIETCLKTLQPKNLRVYDGKQGGALCGPIKTRKRLEDAQASSLKLRCDKKYLEHGRGGKASEVPYMRALFNERALGPYKIIAYETPLMRKKNKNNPDIKGRAISCDLLGINKTELCCIEVKTVFDTGATVLPYALLEGFAYAVCLNWLLRNEKTALLNEIDLCCERAKFLPPSKIAKVTFAIAAPHKDYFAPYVTEKNIDGRTHSKTWFRKRNNETKILESLPIIKNMFAGYLVLEPGIDAIEPKNSPLDIVEPFFAPPIQLKQPVITSFTRIA